MEAGITRGYNCGIVNIGDRGDNGMTNGAVAFSGNGVKVGRLALGQVFRAAAVQADDYLGGHKVITSDSKKSQRIFFRSSNGSRLVIVGTEFSCAGQLRCTV